MTLKGHQLHRSESADILFVIYENLDEAELALGWTDRLIRTTTELRLRRHGITPVADDDRGFLSISVLSVNNCSSIQVKFSRKVVVQDSALLVPILARTWGKSGMACGDASYAVSLLEQLLDEFLNDYLSVNDI